MEQEVCEKCNNPKKIYYGAFCPLCDKPQIETKEFYNLFRCMYHIEALGNPGYKKRMWENLSDQIQGNDSFIEIYNEECDSDEDIKLLFDTFDIKDESISLFVSW
jgi:hypothetical protein